MNPKEFMFPTKSPNKKNEPSRVNPKIVTKMELSHSKRLCIKGTFKISTAKMICINSPFTTNFQSIPFRLREKAKAIKSKVAIPSTPLRRDSKESPEDGIISVI